MPRLDPNDDSQFRIVVLHYRYDPSRHQRRYVTLGAYDNWAETYALITQLDRQLLIDKALCAAESVERLTTVVKEPGYTADHRRRRAEWRQFRTKKVRVRKRSSTAQRRAA